MRGMMSWVKATMVAIGVVAAGWQPAAAQGLRQELTDSSMVENVKRAGVLKVGLSTFVPWSMNAKDGNLVGFEIDVAKQVAEDMGVKVEFVPTTWDGIIPALLAGKFDIIISGMSITPKRNLTVNFTIPYAHSGQGLAASKKLAGDFKTIEDFNKPSVKIAVRRGATPVQIAQKLMPKAELLQFDDDNQVEQEVLNGNAHAYISSEPKPAFTAIMHPDVAFQPIGKNLSTGAEAFAIRKGDPDSLNYFNNWILFRANDGWLAERHTYWFKGRDWASLVEGQ